jgi:tetratricopeptide (TPR) repeat protein
MKRFSVLCFLLFAFSSFAQNKILDSLWKDYRKAGQADTSRLKTFGLIAQHYSVIHPDSGRIMSMQLIAEARQKRLQKAEGTGYNTLGINYLSLDSNEKAAEAFTKCYDLAEKMKSKSRMAVALTNLGLAQDRLTNYSKALEYKLKALKLREESKDKSGLANAYANLGNTYNELLDDPKAIECFLKSMKLAEEIEDKSLIANNLNNIGLVYRNLREYKKALGYFMKSAKLKEEIGNRKGVIGTLLNIGHTHHACKAYDMALHYYQKGYALHKQMNNRAGMAFSRSLLGTYYQDLPDSACKRMGITQAEKWGKAKDYHTEALGMNEEIKDREEMTLNLHNIGAIYIELGKPVEGEKFLNRALKLSREINSAQKEQAVQQVLSEIYTKQGKHAAALTAFRRSVFLADSMRVLSNHDEITRKAVQYEYDKRATADSVKNAEAQKVKDAEIKVQRSQLKQERTQRLALYGGLILVMAFAIFAFNRFRVTRKQKGIIELQKTEVEKQKQLVEEKQKEVMDSIRYAKRIQSSLMPSERYIERILKNKKS